MTAIRLKFPLIIILGILIFVTTCFYIDASSDNFKIKYSALIAYNNPTDKNIQKYIDDVSALIQKHYLELNIQEDFIVPNLDFANIYLNKLEKNIEGFTPTILTLDKYSIKESYDYGFIQNYDTSFPVGESYKVIGSLGAKISYFADSKIKSEAPSLVKTSLLNSINISPKDENIFFGKKDSDVFKQSIVNDFDSIISNSENKRSYYTSLNYPSDVSKLENIAISNIIFDEKEHRLLNLNEDFEFGTMNIKLGNCNKERIIKLEYIPTEHQFKFKDMQNFLDSLCIKQFIQVNGYLVGTCTDCTLYPADKTHALKPDYTPDIVSIEFAPGFQRINKAAYNDFYDMYQAAKADGIHLYVTSGYRSYSDQLSTFNYWVGVEMSKGYSRYQAELNANTYSARPGFSEHQLGTALDLNGAGCEFFSECTGNQQAWNWLAENSYKFGFMISYPQSKQNLTGYIYEPWHYRWIGKSNALEYKKVESQSDMYLQKWLFELGIY